MSGLRLPFEPPGRTHVFHQYTVEVEPESGISRDELGEQLADAGVGSGVYYPRLVHDYQSFHNDEQVVVDQTPRAARAAGNVLSLPVHPLLSDKDVDRIVTGVRDAVG
jgi:dTDP-4-amino-4,6-dideoxygalactose transaminase